DVFAEKEGLFRSVYQYSVVGKAVFIEIIPYFGYVFIYRCGCRHTILSVAFKLFFCQSFSMKSCFMERLVFYFVGLIPCFALLGSHTVKICCPGVVGKFAAACGFGKFQVMAFIHILVNSHELLLCGNLPFMFRKITIG